jgi:hypothetical protein
MINLATINDYDKNYIQTIQKLYMDKKIELIVQKGNLILLKNR